MSRSFCDRDYKASAAPARPKKAPATKPSPASAPAAPTAAAPAPVASTPQQHEALRKRVVALLRSDRCRKVYFSLDNVTISPQTLDAIATQIEKGTLPLNVGVHPGYEASYDPDAKSFEFPNLDYGVNEFEKQTIVHEATHAAIDRILKTRPGAAAAPISGLTDEAASYVAGATFFHTRVKTSVDAFGMPDSSHNGSEIHRRAMNIGAQSAEFADKPRAWRTPFPAPAADADKLKIAIRTHPEYSKLKP